MQIRVDWKVGSSIYYIKFSTLIIHNWNLLIVIGLKKKK